MSEAWSTIAGYEGRYEVSSLGRVRSVSRLVRKLERDGTWGERRIASRILALHTWGVPYPGVTLVDAEGVKARHMVHRIVARAFVPNPLDLPQVNHLDADTMNAAASNLEWSDQAGNVRHAYAMGRRPSGSGHHFASLPRDMNGHCRSAEVFE